MPSSTNQASARQAGISAGHAGGPHFTRTSQQAIERRSGASSETTAGASYRWQVVETLVGYPAEQIEQVTRDASIFFDARWFAMIEALDLSSLIGGAVELRFVVVQDTATRRPVAVCPLLVCRDSRLYFFYSLDKYFFLHWPEEAARMEPDKANFFRRLSRGTSAYRALAKGFGARFGGWVLAASPLSHRGDVAIDPDVAAPDERARIIQAAIEGLQDVARQEALPLCFFGVEQDRGELRRELVQAQFRELFLVYDHVIDLDGLASLEDYFGRFRSAGRRLFRRESQALAKAGLHLERVADFRSLAPELARLYAATYERYGEEHFHHPVQFWSALAEYLGPHAEAVVGYEGGRIAGFSMLLAKNDAWFYRVGRRYDRCTEDGRLYFNLAFYEPLRQLTGLTPPGTGMPLKRFWLGAGATEAKHRRGGAGHALYSYLWFPRRWDRWLLMPYLDNFAKISRLTQSTASRTSTYLRSGENTST